MKPLAAVVLAAACAVVQAGEYRLVPGGRFESVLPQGPVATVSAPVDVAPFAMRTTPVTVGEFSSFVQAHPEWMRGQAPSVFVDRRYLLQWATPAAAGPALERGVPVTEVSWFAARAFCESEGARLPTWIEWEYAAAADATRTDARADPAWRRAILSWYEKPGGTALAAVGGAPNAYGLRDLHGLVWEWVDDFNALFIAGDSRTQGDPDKLKFCGAGALNIIDRDSYAVLMRIALLSSLNAADTTATLGFRCVKPVQGTP
ncbi:formylglycine-generating enzyme family protein [Ramlibacter algicola]|uniref:Formylglycine-generating enzyme family protein n=1 Tax=Ramlibacter algicola TaxID=2795217 RepID=A0A934PZV1_9BURK|nr:formylglycine-generating enzyme family protein [Ramlibacter algicola]MBK0392580.1 formylglycine-generating enzyme family protein [Ramlibacter algicola]